MLTEFSLRLRGADHVRLDMPCQDYCCAGRVHSPGGKEYLVAVVADGVGSACHADCGSRSAAKAVYSAVCSGLRCRTGQQCDKEMQRLLKFGFIKTCKKAKARAAAQAIPLEEYDTTLTAAIFDGKTLHYGHVGDSGAVVLHTDGSYQLATPRQKGSAYNEVYPLRFTEMWQFDSVTDVASAALMTDGFLDVCVDPSGVVYIPALQPAMHAPIWNTAESARYRTAWRDFFKEAQVDRIGDDISFILLQDPAAVAKLPAIPVNSGCNSGG